MSEPQIITSFAGGELTAALNGRVDLTKYKTGAAVMRNFFVDYRGGASTRPGTSIVGVCARYEGNPKPRLIPFVFNSDEAYVIELNNDLMRVIYRGAYVTEGALSITAATNADPCALTIPGHGYVAGHSIRVDGVQGLARPNGISGVNGRTFYITAVVGNNVTIAYLDSNGDYTPIDASTWTAYTSGGTARRIYERPIPWAPVALFALNFVQSADVLTVVHPDYPVYEIRRLALTNWSIVQQTYGAQIGPPIVVASSPLNNEVSDPQYTIVYVLTTIDDEGRESNPSGVIPVTNSFLDQTAQPQVANRITWWGVAGGVRYRIYATSPVPSGLLSGGPYVYGLIGESLDGTFIDVNYAPDFSIAPPQSRNPFSNTGIAQATITASGQGYIAPVLTVVDGTGTGAAIALTADLSNTASPYGELVLANVLAAGTGYSAPTAVITDAAPLGSGLVLAFSGAWVPNPLGTGFVPAPGSITIADGGMNYHQDTYSNFVRAVASDQVGTNALLIDITNVVNGVVQAISWANTDITPSPTTGLSTAGTVATIAFTIIGTDTPGSGAVVQLTLGGNGNPSCVAYLQQRLTFAGSRDKPSTLWLSRPGQFTSFDVSTPTQDDDAITAALYAQEVNIINALVLVNGGLMALTSGGAYYVSGGANDAAVTPTSIRAPAQAFSGALALAPLRIGDDVIYAQARGTGVRTLSFNFYANSFTGQDVSVLSNHLLEGRRVTQWAYAEEPNKILWAVRDDGVLLSFTYLKEQEVYGWARHDTQGEVVSVCTIPEDREDAVYITVNRYVPGLGGFVHMTERMASRLFGANPAATIPSQPEKAWCVDAGAQYPLTLPNTALVFGEQQGLGVLYEVTIVAGGSGYTAPIVQITDISGTGGEIELTLTGGVVTGATITFEGESYLSPQCVVKDATGVGAVVYVRVVNKVLLTFAANAFTNDDIGSVLRVRGGKGPVIEVPNPNQLLIDARTLPAGTPNIDSLVLPRVEAGDWSLTAPVTIIGGLDHLNGSIVQTLADGNVHTPRLVVDGCISLDQPATYILSGQGYTCQLQTMRLETAQQPTAQGRVKEYYRTVVRMKDARGLQGGPDWTQLVELKERTAQNPMGEALPFQRGGGTLPALYDGAPTAPDPLVYRDQNYISANNWTEDGVICIQQSYPLPATVLAIIPWVSNGDDLA